MKFGRTYSLTAQTSDSGSAVVINYPLTLEFDIQRNTLASANTAAFRIYNLKEDTRRLLLKDRWQTDQYRQIILKAGYEQDPAYLPIIFQGNILQAHSYRVKQDWITEIEALDGGFARLNGQVSTTVPAGYDLKDVIASVVKTMPNVALGKVGDVGADQNARGITLMGNSWDQVTALVPEANAFIDDEKVNVIGQNEYLDESQIVINSDSGLLGTPRRFDIRLDATMIFEPRLRVGNIVTLQSLETYYNGLYSINGVHHRGVISGAIGGDATTVISLWKGTTLLTKAAA